MTALLSLDLVRKGVETKQILLTVGSDLDNLTIPEIADRYVGEIVIDRYGRRIPKSAHGTENIEKYTSSSVALTEAMMKLFDRIVNPDLLSRRITVVANDVITEDDAKEKNQYEQMDLFSDFGITTSNNYVNQNSNGTNQNSNKTNNTNQPQKLHPDSEKEERQKRVQEAALKIKDKYGKNAILKGMNLQQGGTTIERNAQIGGHKA